MALLSSNPAEVWRGWSVGGGGDVDGDGRAEVIVGAYLDDVEQSNEGDAFADRTGGPIVERFESVSLYDATALPSLDADPPDSSLAVGRTPLFQSANGVHAVLDKQTGTVVRLVSPEVFRQGAGQAVHWPCTARILDTGPAAPDLHLAELTLSLGGNAVSVGTDQSVPAVDGMK